MNAVISSRMPEGDSFRCPICGARDQIEPSQPHGDAPCPSCGHLSWPSASVIGNRGSRLLPNEVEAILRSAPRRPMFGVVATVARQFRRVFESRRGRETRTVAETSGVYDHWLDG